MSSALEKAVVGLIAAMAFATPLTQFWIEQARCDTPNPHWLPPRNNWWLAAVSIVTLTRDGEAPLEWRPDHMGALAALPGDHGRIESSADSGLSARSSDVLLSEGPHQGANVPLAALRLGNVWGRGPHGPISPPAALRKYELAAPTGHLQTVYA